MYNEERKMQFISEYTNRRSTRNCCITTFNACEKYERLWGADLCTRGSEDLQQLLEHLVGLREGGRVLRFTILRAYVRWCIANGVEGAVDGMDGVDVTGVGKLRTQSVRNPLHLQRYLDAMFDPEREKTTENIYRCFFWLAYAGMEKNDLLLVKTSDVHLSDMVVLFNGVEYPIYREALPCFRNCVRLKEFRYKHPNYSADVECWKPRYPSDYLLRGIRSDPSARNLQLEISRRGKVACDSGVTDMRLSYYRVWLSGVFYRKYEQEIAGIPVDFTDLAWAEMRGKTYKLGTGGNTDSAYMRKLRARFLKDYQNWKKTFL